MSPSTDNPSPPDTLRTRALGVVADDMPGTDLHAGMRIGRYRIDGPLGRGGMGHVYKAQQFEPVRRTVALKLLRETRLDARQLALFEMETQLLAQMRHPAIAQLHDAGTGPDGEPYFAMEFIEGVPIHAYCEQRQLPLDERIALLIRVCDGVQHAHQKGVIHRDLKPDNILVAEIDGQAMPKIIDFGIAATSLPGADMPSTHDGAGTPEYMSPEQALAGSDVDVRSDVYSLGVILNEVLTGRRPPGSRTGATAQSPETASTPRAPSALLETLAPAEVATLARRRGIGSARLLQTLRSDLDWVVLKALSHERSDRYASVSELSADLRRYRADQPVQAAPRTRAYVLAKFARRHRGALLAASAIGVALIGGLALSLYGFWQATEQREQAQARGRELEQVAAFQQSMLRGIDIEGMGQNLSQALRGQAAKLANPKAAFDEVLDQISTPEIARGLIDRNLLAGAATTIAHDFGNQPLLAARLNESVGAAYRGIGNYARAAAIDEAVLEVRRRDLGEQHPDSVRASVALVEALHLQGEAERARSELARAQMAAAGLAADDPLRLELDYLQGNLDFDAADFATAEAVQRSGVERARDAALRYRYSVALARTLIKRDQPVQARELLDALLVEQRGEASGATSAEIAETLGTLLIARDLGNDLPGALQISRELYAGNRQRLGADHPASVSALNSIAVVLYKMGKLDEASGAFRESLAAYTRSLGAQHPRSLRAQLNLASALQRSGDVEQALPMFRAVLGVREKVLGPDHPDTLLVRANIAAGLRDRKRYAEALLEARQVIDARLRTVGPDTRDSGDTFDLLGDIQQQAGHSAEARDWYEKALASRRKVRGSDDPGTVSTALNLLDLQRKLGDAAAAEQLHAEFAEPLLARDPASLGRPWLQLREQALASRKH